MKDKLVGNITVGTGKFSRRSKTQRTGKTIKNKKVSNYSRNPPPEDRS
jgi:hypothetical protein